MKPIAVVDDEKNIREMIGFALEKENYPWVEFSNGEEAWEAVSKEMPALLILDIMMPRMDGMELCRRIRRIDSRVPILFLSSRDEEIDKVLGLETGGDDYVCKPFGMRELISRIRAALRRAEPPAPGPEEPEKEGTLPDSGPIHLDSDRYTARWKGTPVPLTVTEFRILENLAARPGFVKSREQLMAAAFPEDDFVNDRAADSHIKRIRRKLSEVDKNFDAIESVYGMGYRFRTEE